MYIIKKIALLAFSVGLIGCSAQPKSEPQMPLDMQTVNAYNAKISSSNTVPASERNKKQQEVDNPLNASDNRPHQLNRNSGRANVVLVPSFGYYHGHHRHHW